MSKAEFLEAVGRWAYLEEAHGVVPADDVKMAVENAFNDVFEGGEPERRAVVDNSGIVVDAHGRLYLDGTLVAWLNPDAPSMVLRQLTDQLGTHMPLVEDIKRMVVEEGVAANDNQSSLAAEAAV